MEYNGKISINTLKSLLSWLFIYSQKPPQLEKVEWGKMPLFCVFLPTPYLIWKY